MGYHVPLSRVYVAVAMSALALASCRGSNVSYTPSTSTLANTQSVSSDQSDEMQLPTLDASIAPFCETAPVPGTYVNIVAIGNVHDGTFTPAPGLFNGFWVRARYTATASPSPRPTRTPAHVPYYFYVGTFTDKHDKVVDTVGCATLVTTQNGSALPHIKYNGTNVDGPKFAHNVKAVFLNFPKPVTRLKISNLSASGGIGTYVLSDGSTGVIKFTHRYVLP